MEKLQLVAILESGASLRLTRRPGILRVMMVFLDRKLWGQPKEPNADLALSGGRRPVAV